MQHLSSNKAKLKEIWRKDLAPERTYDGSSGKDEGEQTIKTCNIPFINTNAIQSHNKGKSNKQTKSQSSVPYIYVCIYKYCTIFFILNLLKQNFH